MREHLIAPGVGAVPVILAQEGFDPRSLDPAAQAAARLHDFRGQAGRLVLVGDSEGGLVGALFGLGADPDPMTVRQLPARLPPGDWRLRAPDAFDHALAAVAWGLGAYRFDRYRQPKEPKGPVRLAVDSTLDLDEALAILQAVDLVRDMVNTPAEHMGPLQMETLAREVAAAHGATAHVVVGDALLDEGYPMVHAVGRAAAVHREPRMISFSWNADRRDLPLVALVGKGVAFDTGGLDIKPGSAMRLMKKDMGGAAHALALGRLVMRANLPVRLHVLIAAVENAVSGSAFRPGDVLIARNGLSVEVGNTDAEGRLILGDVLARAAELAPDVTLDFATLTGAARTALGPDLPPLYANDEALADGLLESAARVRDPLWPMPLWAGYGDALESEIADLRNDGPDWVQAGSVYAALFLERFAPKTGAWAHLDIYAWNPRARPGAPVGAEAQGLRAAWDWLSRRYGPGPR